MRVPRKPTWEETWWGISLEILAVLLGLSLVGLGLLASL